LHLITERLHNEGVEHQDKIDELKRAKAEAKQNLKKKETELYR
jgi:hypothetical protein